jgi:ABC-type uncharacterized transport system substrate-binding protein
MSRTINRFSAVQQTVINLTRYWGVSLLVLGVLLTACGTTAAAPEPAPVEATQSNHAGKKILFVNSYHEGYEWSDGIETGLEEVLGDTGIELYYVRMDTKNNPEETFGQDAGVKAKSEIEAFKPDVIIAADDNAQKYLVVPYLKKTDTPVVFVGVNWDASAYGYPTDNVTGMIEVELPAQLVDHLKNYAEGERLGYLTVDSETERKVAQIYNERFFDGQMKEYWVKTYDEFKEQFVTAQEEVDILFVGNNAGIDRWDEAEIEAFMTENTKIPTGTINDWLAPYVLITLAKSPEEQGEWSAQAALSILDGTPVSEIPVVENKRGELILNLDIAEQLGVVFSPTLLRNAGVYASDGGSP